MQNFLKFFKRSIQDEKFQRITSLLPEEPEDDEVSNLLVESIEKSMRTVLSTVARRPLCGNPPIQEEGLEQV